MTRGLAAILATLMARHAELVDPEIAKQVRGEFKAFKEIKAKYPN